MLVVVMGCISTTYAADHAKQAKKKYDKYIESHDLASSVIVDIDKNGIPELLCFKRSNLKAYAFTYNKKTKKMVKLCSRSSGKGYGSYYSVKKKQVVLCSSNTGGSSWYVYKISGTKAKLVKKCVSTRKGVGSFTYKINSKRVSQKTWDKTINAIRKYSYFRGLMG